MATAGIRPQLEQAIKNLLMGVVGIPIVAGEDALDLPTGEYVLVEAGDAERRAGQVFTVPMRVQIMGTADQNGSMALVDQYAKQVYDYLIDECSPLRTLNNGLVLVCGFFLADSEEIRGPRTYGEQINVNITAMLL